MHPLFSLGHVVATPGALEALEDAGVHPATEERLGVHPAALLDRHAAGDWGELAPEDRAENEFSLAKGFRLLSSYPLKHWLPGGPGNLTIWIITEADRSYSTILLPSEY